jgi:hypothetical protein
MPYIKQTDREIYNEPIEALVQLVKTYQENEAASPVGQLNYIITSLLLGVYKDFLPNYSDFNEIVGVLECAKLEIYRRAVSPYEDKKIKENGDVGV